jgi:hypothetical protein
MNLALDHLADNPVIDELVSWPPRAQRIVRVRGCNALFRKPFIEVTLADGEVFQRHFPRQGFAEDWAEARVILQTLTRIEVVSDFEHQPVADRDGLVARVLACRDECIAEAGQMFDAGMYAQFLQQFGEDCAALPEDVERRIAIARERLSD